TLTISALAKSEVRRKYAVNRFFILTNIDGSGCGRYAKFLSGERHIIRYNIALCAEALLSVH
ncbi:MAG: hypothetical protein AAFU58_00820, partial [Pseudomonadota bacterium]